VELIRLSPIAMVLDMEVVITFYFGGRISWVKDRQQEPEFGFGSGDKTTIQ
jgi:hypothetical protein